MAGKGGEMKRQPKNLASTLEHRVNAYALAASAAGVSVLALAMPAEGKIVYTKTNVILTSNSKYFLDLNHDGITDFTIRNSYTPSHPFTYAALFPSSAKGNHAFGTGAFCPALRRGHAISSTSSGTGWEGGAMAKITSGYDQSWGGGANRYLGLEFKIKGKIHYAWARFKVVLHEKTITATLTGYAYETIPGEGIIAGKTKGPDVITVQDPTLGHLAAGAVAMPARRRNGTGATH
jgi:hypothetical protein